MPFLRLSLIIRSLANWLTLVTYYQSNRRSRKLVSLSKAQHLSRRTGKWLAHSYDNWNYILFPYWISRNNLHDRPQFLIADEEHLIFASTKCQFLSTQPMWERTSA